MPISSATSLSNSNPETLIPELMAATRNQIRQALEGIFEANGVRLHSEEYTIKIDYFHGTENEDPTEWLTVFERATVTNRWTK